MLNPFNKDSLRFRITIGNILVLTFILFSFIIVLNLSIHSILNADINRRLKYVAEEYYDFIIKKLVPRTVVITNISGRGQFIVINKSGFPLPPPPPPEFKIPANSELPAGKRYFIKGIYYSNDGDIIHCQSQFAPPPSPIDLDSFIKAEESKKEVYSNRVYNNSKYRLLYTPIVVEGIVLGTIQSAMPLGEYETMVETINKILLAFLPFALLIAWVSGQSLTNRILEPIKRMTQAADRITDSDLSLRLPVTGKDEFAYLGNTLNNMLSRLERAFNRLTEAFERERIFTSDASHELRTPLTVIKASTTLALRKERDCDYYKKSLLEVESATKHMEGIIEDMLTLARADNNTLRLQFENLSIKELIEDITNMISPLLESRTVNISLEDEDRKVYGDYKQLKGVLKNLLENAIRHTDSDGKIGIRTEHGDEKLTIAVTDNGDGIPAEHLPHITERFYRVDSSRNRKAGGSGLGLAICKRIVELHNGAIEISSEVGKGSEIRVILPDKKS